jgi:hypothetical protein
MRPVSDRFLRAIRGSHKAFIRATVLSTFQEGTAPDGVEVLVEDGEVTADASASIRGRLTLNLAEEFPVGVGGLLAPYGNEVFVERGIDFGGGQREMVSLGYYRIYDVNQDNAPNGTVELTGFDRMSAIVDARMEAPRQFTSDQSIEAVFEELVFEVYPDATILFDFDAAGTLIGSDAVVDQDRYAFLHDLAKGRGKVMFWDYAGKLRVESPPDPANPVFTVDAGRQGVLVSLSRTLNREGVYNAVVALGERTGQDIPPVRAVARDLNPSSPTYWLGSFGKVPRYYSSPFVTTIDQAQTAAFEILRRGLGLPYSAEFGSIVNPALEAFDPVRIRYPGQARLETHILERVTIPLVVDRPLTASTREQSTVTIGVE